MKKCTWKRYAAGVMIAAMLAGQPMAAFAQEAAAVSEDNADVTAASEIENETETGTETDTETETET